MGCSFSDFPPRIEWDAGVYRCRQHSNGLWCRPTASPHLARWPPVKKVDKEGAVGDVSEGVAEKGDQERRHKYASPSTTGGSPTSERRIRPSKGEERWRRK